VHTHRSNAFIAVDNAHQSAPICQHNSGALLGSFLAEASRHHFFWSSDTNMSKGKGYMSSAISLVASSVTDNYSNF
jgi:hypothetical protein